MSFSESDQGFAVEMGKTQTVGPGGGSGLPHGGKAGQYLRKKSDANGDVEWADLEIPEEYGRVIYDSRGIITIV